MQKSSYTDNIKMEGMGDMKMLQRYTVAMLCFICVSFFVLSGCTNTNSTSSNQADGKINIVTSIAQIAEPISIIGGEHVHVTSLMGSGVDPHLYQASLGDIKKLDGSDIVFYSGLHLESNMIRVFEEISQVKPTLGISDELPAEQLLYDAHGAIDPHVWFDIDLWKEALAAATDELIAYAPQYRDDFESNKEAYFAQLDQLKQSSIAKISQIAPEQRVLVTAHDAFGYFGRLMGLQVVGLQGLSTEAEIGLTDIDETISLLQKYHVPAVFIESSINPDSIKAVIEGANRGGLNVSLGGELFSDAMGEENTYEGTYIGMYEHNIDTIYEALSGKGE